MSAPSRDRMRVVSVSPRRNMNRWATVLHHALAESGVTMTPAQRKAAITAAMRYAEEEGWVLTAQVRAP